MGYITGLHFFRSWRIRRRIAIISIIVMAAALTTIVINPMSTKSSNMESLDEKIALTTYLLIGMGAITVIITALSFHYRADQSQLMKQQREQDAITIAETNAKSAIAIAVAEAAHLKQTQAELELERLRSSLSETSKKTEITSKKEEKTEKQIARRTIDMDDFVRTILPFAGLESEVALCANDADCTLLEQDLVAAFRKAQWNVSEIPIMVTFPTTTGVLVSVSKSSVERHDRFFKAASLIVERLTKYGIRVSEQYIPKGTPMSENVVKIWIGVKPTSPE
jgi:hypothetical protein